MKCTSEREQYFRELVGTILVVGFVILMFGGFFVVSVYILYQIFDLWVIAILAAVPLATTLLLWLVEAFSFCPQPPVEDDEGCGEI